MSFTEDQKNKAKILDKFSKIYKNIYISDKKFQEQFTNGYIALEIFLGSYAYERQGSPNAFKKIALDCISKRYDNGNKWAIPTEEDVNVVWEDYKQIAKNEYNLIDNKGKIKINQKRNPLSKDGGILVRIKDLKETNNIAKYVATCLIDNETKKAYEFIKKVRGCGEKIVPFYLRDIADKIIENKSIENESKISDLYLLQPIDTWLKQTFKIIFNEKEVNTHEKQKEIVELCEKAKVSSISFNQGAWILGNQFAGNYKDLKELLNKKTKLQNLVKKKIKKLNIHIDALKDVEKSLMY